MRGIWSALSGVVLLSALTAAGGAATIAPGPPGDAFYSPPSPLPVQRDGAIIWARPFSGGSALSSASVNYRLLYETLTVNGSFVAVSGTLAIPRGAPPANGWPLISWAHGTVGDGPQCAPSRTGAPNGEQRMLDGFVQRGYAVAQTDYEGNGTPGIHPYMVGAVAARDVTSIVLAARELVPQIGRTWVVMGHSEGGAAALATAVLGQKLAPSLDLAGVVSYAPFVYPEAILEGEMHADKPNSGMAFLALLIEGFSTADPRVVPSEMLEPDAMRLMPEVLGRCIDDLMDDSAWARFVPLAIFRPQGEASVEALYSDLVANDPMNFSIGVPALLVQGASDTMVSPMATLTLSNRLRHNGAAVTLQDYAGATHGSVLAASSDDVADWLAKRFAAATAAAPP
jgi:alpha-beta hydrolase superfamily lysophospholipase